MADASGPASYVGFRWEGAPLSHWAWPLGGVIVYLLITWALAAGMRSRQGLELKRVTALHNEALSFGSLVMCAGTAMELVQRYRKSGDFVWFFCEAPDGTTEGPLYFWSYVYYLSKYYEMLDTVLVLLQKSRVPNFGLQVYHHAAVVVMAWLWCEYRQSLQWGGLMFNTFVHVVMYQYYACRVLGVPTPWKRWITKLQIVQFVTSFLLLMGTLYIVSDRWKVGATCAGMNSLLYNCLFNATLLLQFVGIDKRNAQVEKKNS